MKKFLFFLMVIAISETLAWRLDARPEDRPANPSNAAQAAAAPTIPPAVSSIWPVGMKRGSSATFKLQGRNLAGLQSVIFDAPGLTARVLEIVDVPEPERAVRPGVDLAAKVPEGKKQEAKLEIAAAPTVEPGIHWFRVRTPLGTSNMGRLDVGTLTEVDVKAQDASSAKGQAVTLPATLVGTLAQPGEVHSFQFDGRAGEELVFQVVASEVESKLRSLLVLRDSEGRVLAKAGEYAHTPDAVLTCKLPGDGKFTISLSDRERSGGMDHFYRLVAGALPYVTSAFPLGVRAGQPAEVEVEGVNLGGIRKVSVRPPKSAEGWTTLPLRVTTSAGESSNRVMLAVGEEPEVMEKEPNNSPSEAETITIPATVNGRIYRAKTAASSDEDFFRFTARKGQQLTLEVAAARLGSPLDSLIEILDADGRPIPRATVRCLNQTSLTLYDRDSRLRGYRIFSTTGLREGDYLMAGEELNQVEFIPDQPDADILLSGYGNERFALLGTSPQVHTVNETIYKAEVLEPGAEFPPNGLPVFHLTYRNDDGGPGIGVDSRLDFTAPRDGDYFIRVRDTRGLEGKDFAYRLTIRPTSPDFELAASTENPNVPQGGRVPITVTANRGLGYEGPIEVELRGLPKGLTAKPATIPAGQVSVVVILEAAADAPSELEPVAPFEIIGKGEVNGGNLLRVADSREPLRVASIMPSPDVLVAAEPKEIMLEPGQTTTVTLRVKRMNGFHWRVPCNVVNLPPGVRVVNVGLNGVLVPENETSRTFALKAEDWARPIEQPIYVVATAESNSPTLHASAPLDLKVSPRKQVASTSRILGAVSGAASKGEKSPR